MSHSRWSSRKDCVVCFTLAGACLVAACRNEATAADLPEAAPSDGATAAPLTPKTALVPDADITRAIERHFREDRFARSQHVKVSVTQGVATVSGPVSDLLAKERAIHLIETLRGVRSVVDQVVVEPEKRTDEQVGADVKSLLEHDNPAHAAPIGVAVKDGHVTLSGTTDSWQEQRFFADLAKGVPGVRSVANNVLIHYVTRRSEAEIGTDVKTRIANDVWLDGNTLVVRVAGDQVYLSGVVGSVAQRSRARDDGLVAGVDKVDTTNVSVDWLAQDDQRRVNDYPVRADADVAQAVRDAFRYDPRLKTFLPQVAVRDGVAVLTGIVDTWKARRAAEADADDTVGVWSVDDEVVVQSGGKPTDADVERAVKQVLSENLLRAGTNSVDVSVAKGKVTLHGTVSSATDRLDAVVAAQTVPGVTQVEDDLTLKVPPDEVKENIENRLFEDPMVERNAVTVSVTPDGIVTVAGTVSTWGEIKAAADDALLGGATRVVNVLKLRNHPELRVRSSFRISSHPWETLLAR